MYKLTIKMYGEEFSQIYDTKEIAIDTLMKCLSLYPNIENYSIDKIKGGKNEAK